MNKLLAIYGHVMCRAIWAARQILPAKDGPLPDIAVSRRDFEWHGRHFCEVCRTGCRHKFIDWMDEDVTTAQCSNCGFEGTL